MSKYLLNKPTKKNNQNIKYITLTVAVAFVAFFASNLGMITPGINNTPPKATVAAKGGTGGSGKTSAVSMPTDWPVSIPVPNGVLIGTNVTGAPSAWVLQFLVNDGYDKAMQNVENIYLKAGFTKPADVAVYENLTYRITVVGTARDHSPTETYINIYLQTL